MSLALLFHYLLLNMFRMLVHPPSGACDLLWIYFMCCIALVRCVLVSQCDSTIKMMHGPINVRSAYCLHLVAFLLTLNYDARNHEIKTPTILNPAILHSCLTMKMEQGVPKHRYIKFGSPRITKKKA
jgi:hypothetical protein